MTITGPGYHLEGLFPSRLGHQTPPLLELWKGAAPSLLDAPANKHTPPKGWNSKGKTDRSLWQDLPSHHLVPMFSSAASGQWQPVHMLDMRR